MLVEVTVCPVFPGEHVFVTVTHTPDVLIRTLVYRAEQDRVWTDPFAA